MDQIEQHITFDNVFLINGRFIIIFANLIDDNSGLDIVKWCKYQDQAIIFHFGDQIIIYSDFTNYLIFANMLMF